MAKFDSQYAVQIAPEDGDKILIAAAQGGAIMALPYGVIKSQLQKLLNSIDDELSLTSLHPVQNRIITAALNDIRALIQPPEKEVISATVIASIEGETGEEGAYYFIKPATGSSGTLYLYTDNSFVQQTPSADMVYTVLDAGEVKIFLWNGTAYAELANGEAVDNTIYIKVTSGADVWTVISTTLESYKDEGQYNVFVTYKLLAQTKKESFTLVNTKTITTKLTQLLTNRYGFRIREARKGLGGVWTFAAWTIQTYSLDGHTHTTGHVTMENDSAITLTNKLASIDGLITGFASTYAQINHGHTTGNVTMENDSSTTLTSKLNTILQSIEDLKPLIYAGL